MSQKRFGKGLSLGQTVELLRETLNAPKWGELYSAHAVAELSGAALYHINKLRAKLKALNAKVHRGGSI